MFENIVDNKLLSLKEFEEAKVYWLQKLSGQINEVNLIRDFPTKSGFKKNACRFAIDRSLYEKLLSITKGQDLAIYVILLSALKVMIYKYSGQEDVVVGSPVYVSEDSDIKYNHYILLRDFIYGEMSFKDIVADVRQTVIDGYKYQYYPFDRILSSVYGSPYLLRVVLYFKNIHKEEDYCRILDSFSSDISIAVERKCNHFEFTVNYNSELFKESTVKRFLEKYVFVLEKVLCNSAAKVQDIELVTEEEIKQILDEFNNTHEECDRDKAVHELFEEQVDRAQESVAVVFGDSALTYGQLDRRANQLAHYLKAEHGIKTGSVVGILMEQSVDRITAMLGVLKAGGAYIPIDPCYPVERVKAIVDDSSIRVLISSRKHIGTLNKLQWECRSFKAYICLDSEDIYSEEETEKSELMNKDLWEYVGTSAEDDIEGGGWTNSYTGENLSPEEMEEYSENILNKLMPYLNERTKVLEIGCASGLSMFKIAPLVGLYYGTDLSKAIIDRNEEKVRKLSIGNIRLACMQAHEICRLDEKDFDIVIINSVIQCFHGYNYLRGVIQKAVDVLGEKGMLFIGDVMDQDLKVELIGSLQEFMKENRGKGYRTKTDFSTELFVSRDFFQDVAIDIEEIESVSFTGKIHTIENELTKFRYDALFYINKDNRFKEFSTIRNRLQHDRRVLEKYSEDRVGSSARSEDIAYIIYTSGTTGKPKGVMIRHGSLANLCCWHNAYYSVTESDRATQYAGFSFDASVWEVYPYLVAGASIYLIGDDQRFDTRELNHYFEEKGITISFLPTQICEQFIQLENKSLRKLLTGGDKLKYYRSVGYDLINNYGPTENTVVTTSFEVKQEYDNIPIGKPVWNTEVYILDRDNRLQPIGMPGELCVSGCGLATGYLNNAQLTSEKFVKNPFKNDMRMYRTGDMARWLPDGNIEFLGRIDQQVKIRGYRIELGEIESKLICHDLVRSAVVIDREDREGNKYLCAYLEVEGEYCVQDFREYLLKELPEYMVPAYYVIMDKIPLTPNGKIDKKNLPDPEGASRTDTEHEAPRDEIECKLVEIWKEVLETSKVSINDNFFEIGGHSLKATVLTSKIYKEMAIEVPLSQVFNMPNLKALADYIRNSDKCVYSSIKKAERKDYYPVSSAQRRMFVLNRLEDEGTTYNLPFFRMVKGQLNIKQLEEAFKILIRRHGSLRTSFDVVDNEPVQRIHEHVDFNIIFYEEDEDKLDDIIKIFVKPFDLSKAPLMRVGLVKTGSDSHLFMFDMHHIISDGVSMNILIKELTALYKGKDFPELQLQYNDFSEWQNQLLKTDLIKKQETYWLEVLKGDIPVLNFPTDYQRTPFQTFDGDKVFFEVGESLLESLSNIASKTGATLYMILLAAYNVLLAKYTSQEDIIVGSPTAGRSREDLENIIGMFVNTIVMRSFPSSTKTYLEFLQETKQNALKAFENQDYQFEMLVDKLELNMNHSRNPLFDVFFAYENLDISEIKLGEAEFIPYEYKNRISKFDITLFIGEKKKGLKLEFEYNINLFKRETIERMGVHFINILKQIAQDPLITLSEIDILTHQERSKILFDFNNNQVEHDFSKTIHSLFEEAVKKGPGNIALCIGEEELTYRGLNEKSNQMARSLREKGVRPGSIIGIMAERSIEMIVGIMGVLKAGGAYLPIDPSYPYDRIRFMLEDSQAEILLMDKGYVCIEDIDIKKIYLYNNESYHEDKTGLVDINKPSDLAYIIYTSGTTGKPKGVMVEHGSMSDRIRWRRDEYKLGHTDSVLQTFSFAFDGFVTGLFTPIISGSKIILMRDEEASDPVAIKYLISVHKITHFIAVPTLYSAIMDCITIDEAKSLRIVTLAGERIPPKIVEETVRKNKSLELVNEYGPTECTVVATICRDLQDKSRITIGKPIENTMIYILNSERKVLPVGVPGEIYISGIGVARGYLNKPELTKDKFMSNPFVKGERMYKTGDLGRWLSDGSIEFLGRSDHQVKVRGFRIELEEIENCLLAHKEIRQAVVLAREDESGNNYLCAYIVSLRELLIADLRKHLSDEMPDYMIPTYFVRMDKFPVTHNGKVDRILLPEPGGDIDTGVEYEAPRNEIEKKMAGIWQEILSLKNEPGINHDFFELGGHSLKATILVSRIHKEFQAEMPLSILFKKSTIKDVSEYVQNANKSIFSSINPVDKRDYYPLSSAQKRMFLLNHMGEKNTVYNTPSVTIIEGNLDRERVESVFRKLIVRHEPFRTRFKLVDDNPVQEIFEEVDFKLEYSEVEESELESKIKQFIRPFDLSMAPILRVDLIRLDYNKHAMLVDMHHIISDGVSAAVILTQEFSKLYNGEGLPQLRIQYKDYAVWQNEVFESEVLKRQERYWLERFSGEIPVLNLPTDYLRPSSRSFEGTTFYFSIDKNMSKRLKALAEQNGVTLYMVMLAAYNVLLYRYTGQEDIVVGTPVANRTHDDLQNVLGMFVNTLAMRNFPDGKKTFIQFMHEVRENALKAYQNQDYQFEQLVEKLNIKRDISRSPLFDTIFVLQNVDFKELNAGALKVSPYRFKGNTSKFDISLSAVDTDEKIEFGIEYCTKLFKQETIERLSQHFTNILKSICQNPLTEINNLDMSSNEEKQKLIYEFNRTESEYSFNKTIHELFEEAVEKKPDNIAVMFDGSTLTYKELNNKSNQLARFLKEKGVGAESIVGIMADRSLEMVVGIMGILKAGGAYLPISPDYPDERASYMLNDSGSKILLSQKHLLKRNVSFDTHVVELEDEDIYRRDCSNFIEKGYPSDVAYVIYTSGSTGKPKGVMIEHSSVVNILTALQKRYPLMESDVYLFKTAFTFDVSVAEIFGWFHENGRLAILSKGMEKDTEGIVEAIEKYKVTHMNFVPSMLNAFISMLPYKDVSKLQSLKYIFAAGEAIPKELVNKFYSLLREVELVNIYGPTEATIYATYYPLRNLSCETNVPIGRPLDNVRVYVLGKSNCLQPIGIPGELCIAGAGLARGYLNRPKLSEEKFVNNTCLPKERLYRTGDLVRWLPDGNIEFLGRIDHQVKIRGYRVELGEIESHLLEYENIKEAVVTLRENKGGDRFLCAYYVSPEELSINKLRTYLLKKLPDYMMPAYFMKIEEIPLTASGKIDRKALPEPGGYIKTGVEYEAPRNKLEESLVEVWKEVLGINKVGIDDNFFSLGGDSIKVIQIQSRLHKYKLSFETKDIFQNPTIRELAEYVKLMSDSAGQGIVEGEAALTPIQIWFFERNFTNMHHWNQAVMLYKEDGFREEVLKVVLDQIVQHHDALRMIYISSDEGVRQVNRGLKGSLFGMAVYDLTCEKEYERIILERADILHKSFDISKGPLIKAAMFKTIRGDYLLISVHHLVIDGVSWRIIFEDIEIAYRQMEEEKEVQLPMKTVSYKDWSQKLCEYAGSIFKRELKYWKEVELTLCPSIPRDREINGNRIKDSRNISIQLPEEDTSKLLKEVNRAYNTEINDILLAALGGAVKNWAGINRVLVNIEGHGREDIIEGIDITRTVGWFTSLYPVILDIENADDISYLLRTTKEMLRRIPNKGVGYGIIKYLGAKKSGEEIEFKLAPDICFNYLGQFEQNTNRPIFKIADLNVGSPISPESEKAYALDIVSMVVEGRLRISVSYSTKEYNESTIMDFIEEYRIIIQKIIEHCIDKEGTEMTLSDYSDSELQEQDLEDFFNSLK